MRIDPKYLKYRKHYVLQSIYASISIFILTLILNDNPVLIASIGSTAFVVFAMPKSITSQPKRIIGAHFSGFIIGSCFYVFPLSDYIFFAAIWHSLSVGITVFIMVVFDLEHPPAAGTALGMTLIGYNSYSLYKVSISVFLLAFISYVAKPFLRDLV